MPEQRWSTLIRGQQADVLKDDSAPATILLLMLIDEFGTECLDWEPETLQLEVKDAWSIELPQTNWDKVYALMTVLTTNLFEQNLETFTHVCNALSGAGADFTTYDPATVEEMSTAIGEIVLLDPPEKGNFNFSDEVKTYMQVRLAYEGFITPPKMLAPFVEALPPLPEPEIIPPAEEDYKAHYNAQRERILEIEDEVRNRIQEIITRLQKLPLRFANKDKIKELAGNAARVLATK